MDIQQTQLEAVMQQMGEAVIASAETVDRLSERMDVLANQVQSQGYAIFALDDLMQKMAEVHGDTMQRLDRLTDVLERLVIAIEGTDPA